MGTIRSAGVGIALAVVLALAAALPAAPRPDLSVVVWSAGKPDIVSAVAATGGVIERHLPLVGGVAARVPAEALEVLARQGIAVTPDEPLRLLAAEPPAADGGNLQLAALNPGAGWSPEAGSGVGVALVDTGVVEVPDLTGRVVHGPDYTSEGDGVDRYGHGTFMAGLIAGDGTASGGRYQGVAPGAHIVSVKVSGRDGITTLSTLLEAIGWVVVNQDTYGIRVLNLSVGLPTRVAPQADPLSAAVEAAWAAGITVVAASGNEGTGTVTSPGRDPWVVTVGATDTNGTAAAGDDTVADWSGSGRVTGKHKPELLAPGVSTVSLRVPGSLVDESYPQARVGAHYFLGSGTSMSTALVSGAVAALAEFRPFATPDDLKGALVSAGVPVTGTSARAVDLLAADAAAPSQAWRQHHRVVFGGLDGRLRNGMPWTQESGPSPEQTWQRARWADGEWQRARWADGEWQRARWADSEWQRARWAGANFARARWADAHFARARWAEADWARARWAGRNWSSDESWVRLRWAAAGWEANATP